MQNKLIVRVFCVAIDASAWKEFIENIRNFCVKVHQYYSRGHAHTNKHPHVHAHVVLSISDTKSQTHINTSRIMNGYKNRLRLSGMNKLCCLAQFLLFYLFFLFCFVFSTAVMNLPWLCLQKINSETLQHSSRSSSSNKKRDKRGIMKQKSTNIKKICAVFETTAAAIWI